MTNNVLSYYAKVVMHFIYANANSMATVQCVI